MTVSDDLPSLDHLGLGSLLERTVELHEASGTSHADPACPSSPAGPRTVRVRSVRGPLCSRCTPGELAPALEAAALARLRSRCLARSRFAVRDLPTYARTHQRLLALEAFAGGANLPLSPVVEPARLHLVEAAARAADLLRAELVSSGVRAHVTRVCAADLVEPTVPAPLREVAWDLALAWRSWLGRGLEGEPLARAAARVVASLAPERALHVPTAARLAAECVRGWDELLDERVRSSRDLLAVVDVPTDPYWPTPGAAVAGAFSLRSEGERRLLLAPECVVEWLTTQTWVSGLSRTGVESLSSHVVENVSALWDPLEGPLSVAATLLAAAQRV